MTVVQRGINYWVATVSLNILIIRGVKSHHIGASNLYMEKYEKQERKRTQARDVYLTTKLSSSGIPFTFCVFTIR